MATNKLTDATCRKVAANGKPQKLSDGYGMFLFVSPVGAKVWRVAYRLDGKQQLAVLGPYPLLSLADARAKRDKLRAEILNGTLAKVEKVNDVTFAKACEMYWAGRKDVTDRYLGNATRGLDMHLGALGTVNVREITRQKLLDELMILDAQDKHVYSRRVRVWASMVLEWAKEQGYCEENVAQLINPKTAFGKARVRHHAALKLADVPAFLARLDYEKDLLSVLACKMLMLTWVRTGELRLMLWDEIEGDLWRIPAGKMKRGKEHLVPLPVQAVALLTKLKARSRSEYVFPNDRRMDRPMSENSVLYLLGRIGYGGVLTGHGFRSIGSTWAHEAKYPSEAIEMQLAHTPGDKVASAYNRAEYLGTRREMLQAFADWVDKCSRASQLENANPSSQEG